MRFGDFPSASIRVRARARARVRVQILVRGSSGEEEGKGLVP